MDSLKFLPMIWLCMQCSSHISLFHHFDDLYNNSAAMAYNRRTMGTRYIECFRSNTIELTNALTLGVPAITPSSRATGVTRGNNHLPFISTSILPSSSSTLGDATAIKMTVRAWFILPFDYR
jgi:hypothetical protein